MSLKNFSSLNNVSNKNINAFEYGRANNIKYLYYYYSMCYNRKQQYEFMNGLFKLL